MGIFANLKKTCSRKFHRLLIATIDQSDDFNRKFLLDILRNRQLYKNMGRPDLHDRIDTYKENYIRESHNVDLDHIWDVEQWYEIISLC